MQGDQGTLPQKPGQVNGERNKQSREQLSVFAPTEHNLLLYIFVEPEQVTEPGEHISTRRGPKKTNKRGKGGQRGQTPATKRRDTRQQKKACLMHRGRTNWRSGDLGTRLRPKPRSRDRRRLAFALAQGSRVEGTPNGRDFFGGELVPLFLDDFRDTERIPKGTVSKIPYHVAITRFGGSPETNPASELPPPRAFATSGQSCAVLHYRFRTERSGSSSGPLLGAVPPFSLFLLGTM